MGAAQIFAVFWILSGTLVQAKVYALTFVLLRV
jgi:hypothetical protein